MNDHELKLRKMAAGGVSLSTLFPTVRDMQESLNAVFLILDESRQSHADMERRINEIRNSMPALLADIQDAYKKYDFTMRRI